VARVDHEKGFGYGGYQGRKKKPYFALLDRKIVGGFEPILVLKLSRFWGGFDLKSVSI
jgi:hypothetical protein